MERYRYSIRDRDREIASAEASTLTEALNALMPHKMKAKRVDVIYEFLHMAVIKDQQLGITHGVIWTSISQ